MRPEGCLRIRDLVGELVPAALDDACRSPKKLLRALTVPLSA